MSDIENIQFSPDFSEEKALKDLYNKYFDMLCLYAETITRDKHIAADIVEELFIYIWTHAKNFKIKNSLGSYLFRSVKNNCMRYMGQEKAKNLISDDCLSNLEYNDLLHPVSHELPLQLIINRELGEKIEETVNALPEECRKIYMLAINEEMSYSEIAKQLSINIGTVKTQMSRAFNKIHLAVKKFL